MLSKRPVMLMLEISLHIPPLKQQLYIAYGQVANSIALLATAQGARGSVSCVSKICEVNGRLRRPSVRVHLLEVYPKSRNTVGPLNGSC